MQSAIENFQTAKRARLAAEWWAGLIGKPYRGGGGGRGELSSLCMANGGGSPTVYFQEYDGASNYHPMPEGLVTHLEAAIKARFSELLADALARQNEALKALAAAAVQEHAALMEAAGIQANT